MQADKHYSGIKRPAYKGVRRALIFSGKIPELLTLQAVSPWYLLFIKSKVENGIHTS